MNNKKEPQYFISRLFNFKYYVLYLIRLITTGVACIVVVVINVLLS